MKIAKKITFGFVPIAVMFAIAGGLFLSSLNETKSQINQIIASNMKELHTSEHIYDSIQEAHASILQYQVYCNDAIPTLSPKDNVKRLIKNAMESINVLEKETLSQIQLGDAEGERDELREIQLLRAKVAEFSSLTDTLFSLHDSCNHTAAHTLLDEKINSKSKNIHDLIRDLENDAQEEISSALNQTLSHTQFYIIMTTVLTLMAILASVLLGRYISQSIAVNITKLHQATKRIEKGELNTRVDIRSDDELGQIATDINAMTKGLGEVIQSRDNLSSEVEERKRIEQALAKNEQKYRTIFDSSRDTFMLLDRDGFLDCNYSTLKMFECHTREEFLGHHPSEFSPAFQNDGNPSLPAANAYIEEAYQKGYALFEWTHKRKDGDTFPAEVLLTRITIEEKELLVSSIRDISKRKKDEELLRDQEEHVRLLLDSTAEGIFGIDTAGNCTMVNHVCLNMLGYHDESELMHKNMIQMIHHSLPDGSPLPEEQSRIYHAFNSGLNAHVDSEVFWRKDGTPFPVSYWAHPIYKDEVVIGAVVTFLDISDQIKSKTALRQSREQLQTALEGTITAVAKAVEARDPYTAGHQRRVAELSATIAEEMGLDDEMVKGVYLSASIHDIGKIQLPVDVLSKPGKLLPAEFQLIKGHPEAGYNILKDIRTSWPVADVAYQHHERIDGSGYPRGLKGDEICLEARIIAVADIVEAMTNHRPYRPGLGVDKALMEIQAQRGKTFDTVVVDACIRLFKESRFAFNQQY